MERVLFHCEEDRRQFLLEVGKTVDEADTPDDHKLFIKRRSKLGTLYKNFRRKQFTKLQWHRHRFKMMRSLRLFHHSPEGRRIHRQLGRFLTSHILIPREGVFGYTRESLSQSERSMLLEVSQAMKDEMRFYLPTQVQLLLLDAIEMISEALEIQ